MTGAVLFRGMFAQTAAVSGCVPGFTWATDAGRNRSVGKNSSVATAALKDAEAAAEQRDDHPASSLHSAATAAGWNRRPCLPAST